jgi:flagellar biosynthesis/type III secretory pathway protein FliH
VGAPAARPPARGACTSRDYERDHCTGDSINEGREAVFELEADRQRRELEDARESGYRSGYDDGYERGHEDGTSGW